MPYHLAVHHLYGDAVPQNSMRAEPGTGLQAYGSVRTAGMDQEAAFSIKQERGDRTIVADGVTDEVNLLFANVKTCDAPPGVVAGIERVSRGRQAHGLLQVGTAHNKRVPL